MLEAFFDSFLETFVSFDSRIHYWHVFIAFHLLKYIIYNYIGNCLQQLHK